MAEFVCRAQALGFTHIEANAWISPRMLRELIETRVPISSIHSPCPAKPSSTGAPVSDLSLSSLDEDERREAVSVAKQTIEAASSVAAAAVVLHMGEAPVDRSMQGELSALYTAGRAQTKEYSRVRDELIGRRTSLVAPFLEAAKQSLRELSEYGRERGLMLGLETRFNIREIPDVDEMAQLLNEAPDGPVGYWHDVGHAEVQQRLGICPHEEWLSRFKHKMIGIHLHDVRGISDHYAPGEGDVDWAMIAAHLTPRAVRVCEIGEWNDEERVRRVVGFLAKKGIAG